MGQKNRLDRTPRTVVQIATIPGCEIKDNETEAMYSGRPGIFALCNDGTIWAMEMRLSQEGPYKTAHWREMPGVPQPPEVSR